MNKKILAVKPISQLFPIPMIMGCEGVACAMILQFNNHPVPASHIMKHWPKHDNNPYKGYVGHHLWIKRGYHQTIFPNALVPYLQKYDARMIDSTGQSLKTLCVTLDHGQPVIIYHTVLGRKPSKRTFNFDNQPRKLVSNIHVTVLIGYDKHHYYYIDPLWSRLGKSVIFPAIFPNKYQIIKIKKEKLETSYNIPGRMSLHFQ